MGIKEDARDLLIALEEWHVTAQRDGSVPDGRMANINTRWMAGRLSWTASRLNDAVDVLENSRYVQCHLQMGTREFKTHGVELTAHGRLEAQRLLEAKAKIEAEKAEPLDPLDQAEHLLVLLAAKARKEGRLGPFTADDDLVAAIDSDHIAIRKLVIPLMRDKGWLEKDLSGSRMKLTNAGLEAARKLSLVPDVPPAVAPTSVDSAGTLTLSKQMFLSHKGADKPLVRRFHRVLKELGLDPWLDEDKMPAGTSLERGLLKGMKESCAAVFFVTDKFKDVKWIGAEVEYAIRRTRDDEDFRIIAIVFGDENTANVPELFKPYVHVIVDHESDALWEIIRALPVKVGAIGDREAKSAAAKSAAPAKDEDKPPAAPVASTQPDTRTLLGRSAHEWRGHQAIVVQAITASRQVLEAVPLFAFRVMPSTPLTLPKDTVRLIQQASLYTNDYGNLPWYSEDATRQMKAYVVGSSFVPWYEHEWRIYDDGTFFYEEAIAEDDPLARNPEQRETRSTKRFLFFERVCGRVALAIGFARDMYRSLGHKGELAFLFRWTEMQDRALRFPSRYAPPDKYVCGESIITEHVNLAMSMFDSREWEEPVGAMLEEVFRQFQAQGTPIKPILAKLK